MTREELLSEISKRKKKGDLSTCALAFGHDFHYLSQIATGWRNNDEMLDDILYTIRMREEMEARLRSKAQQIVTSRSESKHHI